MGSDDDTYVPNPELEVQEPKSPSSTKMMPSNGRGGGDGSGAPCLRSLTQKDQVKNLKKNYKRIGWNILQFQTEWARMKVDPWFAKVVAEVRGKSCLGNDKIEMDRTPSYLENVRLLHMAVLMGDLEMVRKILESVSVPKDLYIDSCMDISQISYSALDLAIMCGESAIVDALLEKNANVDLSVERSLHLAVLHARAGRTKNRSKIIQSLVNKGIDINARDERNKGYSAFYLAVKKEKTDIVKKLLKWKDKINLNETCRGGRPPIQIANEKGFKDIEIALMQCEDVRRYIDEAFRDRQAYVDAANAILVGAALIASVTFASWLQPPLNYTTSYHDSPMKYVDVEHNSALGSFWVFNTLSFYFAIGTVVFGAHSVLPRRQLFITETVKKLSQNLLLTSILLAFSVLFVIVAFGIAGFIVLIPILRYRWYMIAPTILGGLVCVGSIGYLFKSLWENRSWNIRNRKRNTSKSNVRIDKDSDSDSEDDESSDSSDSL